MRSPRRRVVKSDIAFPYAYSDSLFCRLVLLLIQISFEDAFNRNRHCLASVISIFFLDVRRFRGRYSN